MFSSSIFITISPFSAFSAAFLCFSVASAAAFLAASFFCSFSDSAGGGLFFIFLDGAAFASFAAFAAFAVFSVAADGSVYFSASL